MRRFNNYSNVGVKIDIKNPMPEITAEDKNALDEFHIFGCLSELIHSYGFEKVEDTFNRIKEGRKA